MKNSIKLIFFFSILTFACTKEDEKKEDNNNAGGNNPPQSMPIDSFPLSIGNSWKYYTESIIDSAGIVLVDQFIDSYWNALSDTLINGMTCTKISQLDSNYDGTTHQAHTYYANKPDGFYGIAEENSGSMFFLKTDPAFFLPHLNLLSAFGNKTNSVDTVFIPDTALYLLKYPPLTNDVWASHEFGGIITVKRKWTSDTTITTGAGTFNCKKLQVFIDMDNNSLPDSTSFNVFQYFSVKGLIQEERHDSVNFGNGDAAMLNQVTKLVQVNF